MGVSAIFSFPFLHTTRSCKYYFAINKFIMSSMSYFGVYAIYPEYKKTNALRGVSYEKLAKSVVHFFSVGIYFTFRVSQSYFTL